MLKILTICVLVISVLPAFAQQQTNVLSFESWKRGKAHIQPQTLDIHVDRSHPTYRAKITDASGKHKYDLVIEPALLDKKSSAISSWTFGFYSKESFGDKFLSGDRVTLLKPSNDPYQDSFTTEDYVGWLSPYCDASVMESDLREPCLATPLLRTKRVVKVEGFYVIFQVTDYRFLDRKHSSMESMSLHVEFTNTFSG